MGFYMAKAKKKTKNKVMKPGKDITSSKAKSIHNKLIKVVEQKISKLTLDFSNVENIDAVGLGLIIAANNSLNRNDADLILKNVPDKINNLFSSLRLDQCIKILPA